MLFDTQIRGGKGSPIVAGSTRRLSSLDERRIALAQRVAATTAAADLTLSEPGLERARAMRSLARGVELLEGEGAAALTISS